MVNKKQQWKPKKKMKNCRLTAEKPGDKKMQMTIREVIGRGIRMVNDRLTRSHL